jgi:hypothetical protein
MHFFGSKASKEDDQEYEYSQCHGSASSEDCYPGGGFAGRSIALRRSVHLGKRHAWEKDMQQNGPVMVSRK